MNESSRPNTIHNLKSGLSAVHCRLSSSGPIGQILLVLSAVCVSVLKVVKIIIIMQLSANFVVFIHDIYIRDGQPYDRAWVHTGIFKIFITIYLSKKISHFGEVFCGTVCAKTMIWQVS
jgi:hypothetical protein